MSDKTFTYNYSDLNGSEVDFTTDNIDEINVNQKEFHAINYQLSKKQKIAHGMKSNSNLDKIEKMVEDFQLILIDRGLNKHTYFNPKNILYIESNTGTISHDIVLECNNFKNQSYRCHEININSTCCSIINTIDKINKSYTSCKFLQLHFEEGNCLRTYYIQISKIVAISENEMISTISSNGTTIVHTKFKFKNGACLSLPIKYDDIQEQLLAFRKNDVILESL